MAHFYVKHDRGYDNGKYDLQKIDLGIALYNFETQMITGLRNPVLTVEDPGIAVPEGVDYVATYTF